jgi:hypothetical protein
MKRFNQQIHITESQLTENGSPAAKRCWSPRNLAAETIFMDLVILAMFFVPVIRVFTASGLKFQKLK